MLSLVLAVLSPFGEWAVVAIMTYLPPLLYGLALHMTFAEEPEERINSEKRRSTAQRGRGLRRETWLNMLGLALLIVPVAVLCLIYYYPQTPPKASMPFDSEKWKAAKEWRHDNVRGEMVGSLLREHQLVGLTREQVVKLLGPPDGIDRSVPDSLQVPERVATEARRWSYLLGMSYKTWDYDFLIISFDDNDRVKSWRIHAG